MEQQDPEGFLLKIILVKWSHYKTRFVIAVHSCEGINQKGEIRAIEER